MTDTDIAALVERLRQRYREQLKISHFEGLQMCLEAADALEACQAERDAALFDKAVAGGKVRVAEARAEKAEAEIERLRAVVDPLDQWANETRP